MKAQTKLNEFIYCKLLRFENKKAQKSHNIEVVDKKFNIPAILRKKK